MWETESYTINTQTGTSIFWERIPVMSSFRRGGEFPQGFDDVLRWVAVSFGMPLTTQRGASKQHRLYVGPHDP